MAREMLGMIDHTGELVNGILVEKLSDRRHKRYSVRCTKCLTNWTVPAVQLPYLSCKNSFCGKATAKPAPSMAQVRTRETAVRSADSASVREFQRQEQEQEAGTEQPRRRSLRDGYFEPPRFSSDRERQSYRDFMQEFEAEQNRPPRELEEFQKTANKLAMAQRAGLLSRPDPEFVPWVDEAERQGFFHYHPDADAANMAAAEQFLIRNPDFVSGTNNENQDKLVAYIDINCRALGIDLKVVTPGLLERAYKKLLAFGLLETPHEIVVESPQEKEGMLDRMDRLHAEAQERAEAQRIQDEELTGVDWQTGQPVRFSAREVNHMTSDEFKRAFPDRVASTFRTWFEAASALRNR